MGLNGSKRLIFIEQDLHEISKALILKDYVGIWPAK